ncbi:MAG TPA: methyltransferase domain-containing protein [Vicinamibacterales bacterium]|nr:methyltransferase domain-containing protein [Vicinamibacterales bacterium]
MSDELKQVRDYWDQRARRAADDCARIESGRKGQRLRFESFLRAHDLQGRSILDIGCGVGDFFARLQANRLAAHYYGIDLSPEMIGRARERFPEGRFELGDAGTINRRFDYTVAFAIHNVKVEHGKGILERSLRQQFEICDVAAHISLLTDRYQGFDPHIQAWRAEEILSLALSITPYAALRHDYLPNDFSLTLYRRPLIDSDPSLTGDLS